jgi:hypothetical protein
VVVFFSELSHVLLQGHELFSWVLDTDWELPMVETLWAARKFSVVLLESL